MLFNILFWLATLIKLMDQMPFVIKIITDNNIVKSTDIMNCLLTQTDVFATKWEIDYIIIIVSNNNFIIETSRGAEAQAYDFECDRLWVIFPLEKMKIFNILLAGPGNKTRVALRLTIEHVITLVWRKNMERKCLNGNGVN